MEFQAVFSFKKNTTTKKELMFDDIVEWGFHNFRK